MDYRREIDGLRAIAVLPVILFHAGFEWISGGFVGVDVFFVISGYLITSVILAEKRAGTFSIVSFYERRVRRILPALFFVLLVCLPFAWFWMLPDQLKDFSKSLVNVSFFLSNIYFSKDKGYFAAAIEEKPLLHTWSLAVEEQYYLLFPILLLLLWRGGKRWLLPVLAIVAISSLIFAEWQSHISPEKIFYDTRGRVWELLIGAFFANCSVSESNTDFAKNIRQATSAIGLALILFSVFAFDKSAAFPRYALLPTLGAILIILFATPQTFAGKLLGGKWLVGIGQISYSAYLWHQPLFAFTRLHSLSKPNSSLLMSLAVFSLVIAYFSWRYVERPFRNRSKFSRKFIFLSAVLMSAVMITIGIAGDLKNGFPNRYSDRLLTIEQDMNNLEKDRFELIRSGECQFNWRGPHNRLDEFLKFWDCDHDPKYPLLTKVPLIVVGDSHSADVVVSLKLNGYIPIQMGGNACSLVPSSMSEGCVKQFDHLKKYVASRPEYTHILLVSRFSDAALSKRGLDEMINFWSTFGKKLIFFTARPEFVNFKQLQLSGTEGKADFSRSKLSERPEVLEYLSENNVTIVNTRNLFCSMTSNCDFKDEKGNLLVIDGHHLSKLGAELFGKKLIESNILPLQIMH